MRSIGKGASDILFPLVAVGLTIPCSLAGWHGNAEWHTLLDTVELVLELVASAVAFNGYHTSRGLKYLVLGSGLAGAAFLDGLHVLVTCSFGGIPALPNRLYAWSELAPRVFLAGFLGATATSEAQQRLATRFRGKGVYAVVAACVLLIQAVPYAHGILAFDPTQPLERLAEVIPALLFAAAALAHAGEFARRGDRLERWLILSLLASLSSHLFYPVLSAQWFDACFIFYHLLKILSFGLILSGLFSGISSVYLRQAESVHLLQDVNHALTREIDKRLRAETKLRESRDELERRIRERTADLEEQSWQLKAAYLETELFLISIPSILIGLDTQGIITRWNPAASEALGLPGEAAIGRPLEACGIPWVAGDIRAEVSRWLLAKTLHRCDELAFEKDGEVHHLGCSIRPIPSSPSDATRFLIIGADITERHKAEAAVSHLAAVVESCDAAIISADLNGKVLTWNGAAELLYGYSLEEVKGRSVSFLYPPERAGEMENILHRLSAGERIEHQEIVRIRKDGERIPVLITYSPIRDESDKVVAACSITVDITERKLLERQLAQAQKLESIGQLAAGIAHEINTPIQYVGDNLRFLQDSFGQLEQLLEGYDQFRASMRRELPDSPFVTDIEALARATRVGYLRTEIPHSIEDSLEGAGRVTEIVRAMKEFSHPGPLEKTPLDINHAIESTVLISRNEWKYVAELRTNLDASLPPVMCVPGEFNQVVLNLIVNAAHAIADVVADQPGKKGTITVSTQHDGEWAEIHVRDTGTGIPEAVQPSIFNPFFTTKGVGKGTGQGLALAHSVIAKKHGGTISFETALGRGTTFKIRLPITGDSSARLPDASAIPGSYPR